MNLVVPPLLQFSNILYWPARIRAVSSAKTQRELYEAFVPPDLDLAEAYATMLKTMALGFLFMPLVPLMAAWLTAAALFLQYYSYKYACLTIYRQPPSFSPKLQWKCRQLLLGLLLAYPIMMQVMLSVSKYSYCTTTAEGGGYNPNSFNGDIHGVCIFAYVIIALYHIFERPLLGCCRMICCCCWPGGEADGSGTDGEPYPQPIDRKRREELSGDGSWSYMIPTPANIKKGGAFRATGSGGLHSQIATQSYLMPAGALQTLGHRYHEAGAVMQQPYPYPMGSPLSSGYPQPPPPSSPPPSSQQPYGHPPPPRAPAAPPPPPQHAPPPPAGSPHGVAVPMMGIQPPPPPVGPPHTRGAA